ncbi:hypothetical protein ACWDYH_09150 [Nocardia goodfellowii]|uniref:Uncharacterized protein n=1 Tax=Nocardia goodfellowii TaxID=882446 RepID=A0ABS4QDI0_9NOCA|nr:hypothetical protein [Nocardia goodfellowii]MBP2189752.1 hypothetical protein [Nocardia goodfellowii]
MQIPRRNSDANDARIRNSDTDPIDFDFSYPPAVFVPEQPARAHDRLGARQRARDIYRGRFQCERTVS